MNHYRATPEQLQEWLADIQKSLDYITLVGPELLRRGQRGTRDGYPSSSRLNEARGGGDGNPVLATVVQNISAPLSDPVRSAGVDITTLALTSRTELTKATRILHYWMAVEPETERKSSITICKRCEGTVAGVGDDRLRAGYCPKCHQAWMRWKKTNVADRTRFEHDYHQRQAAAS